MNQQQFEAAFNAKVGESIKDMIFPAENIPDGFRDYLLLALPCFTYHAVKCTLEEFGQCAEYAGNGGEISMTAAFVALQITRGVTAKDIGVNLAVYCQMNRLLDDMALAWDIITKPFKEAANREINEAYEKQLKQQNASLALNTKGNKIVLPN